MRTRSLITCILGASLLAAAAAGVIACQAGKGEHCQVNSDCESGLVCTNLGFCDTENNQIFDAAPKPDAREDAAPGIDAPPQPDAPPTPDAHVADAPLPDTGT